MDAQPFAALAQVRILLLPVGNISKIAFETWANEIRSFEEIRLGDIPSDTSDDRARFMPSPLSSGHLHLSYHLHPPAPSHDPLFLFRPSHFPLAVIGIAECPHSDAMAGILAHFNAACLENFPPESPFPLSRNCFVFEGRDADPNLNISSAFPGLVVIPNLMGNKKLYIGTLLAELCSSILSGFADIVRRLETPLGNEVLSSTLFPNLTATSDPQASLNEYTMHTIPPMPTQHSEPELSFSTAATRAKSPTSFLKRTTTMGPSMIATSSSLNRGSTLGVPPGKKRQSTLGPQSAHGRLFKVLGDLFLLAGRTMDAVIWYNEAVALFRSPQDSAWHASALEGMATAAVMDSWSSGHGLNNSHSSSTNDWAELADKLTQATSMYCKVTPSSESKEQFALVTYLYTSSLLRHASLLFSVWSAKGWGPLAFTIMLHPRPELSPVVMANGASSSAQLDRISSITGIYRPNIVSILTQAHGPWILHLGPRDRLEMLKFLASMYCCMGFKRKESYFLREILLCVMDLIVSGREETGVSRLSTPAVGLGIKEFESEGFRSDRKDHVAACEQESTEGNSSILAVVEYVCMVYGVDLRAVKFVESVETTAPIEPDARSTLMQNFEEDTQALWIKKFGWRDLQLAMLNEALIIAEALPDYSRLILYALSALKTMHSALDADDQYHCYTISARAFATARRRGDDRQVECWSGNPLIDIEVLPLSSSRVPKEMPISLLRSHFSNIGAVVSTRTGPFFYNPRQSMAGNRHILVLQNEEIEFVVTLRNHFAVALDLKQVALSTSGVPFQSRGVAVVIPPHTLHRVTLSGKVGEEGNLTVRGCWLQTSGSALQEFTFPLLNDVEQETLSHRKSVLAFQEERVKFTGLQFPETFRNSYQLNVASDTTTVPRFMELKVIPELPLLRIRRASLTHGAVMLYEGETSFIRVDVENVSSLPIDFLDLSFEDSTKVSMEQALADDDLSTFDKYEMEYSLVQRPVCSWDAKGKVVEIAAGRETAVTIACYGKAGCTNAIVQFVYSLTRRSQMASGVPAEVFYTRQLSFPISVTVYQMLECHGMDIMPLSQMKEAGDKVAADSRQALSLLPGLQEYGWSIFVVDVRNTYGLPFEVMFALEDKDAAPTSTSQIVSPGSTHRFLLPFKRFTLPEAMSSQPIPSLLDRQFVVTRSDLTSEEDKVQRELFWYREQLFKRIKGRWKDSAGLRSGELSLRSQRLTLPMLNALRSEVIGVKMLVDADDEGTSHKFAEGARHLPPNHFINIRTKATNLSSSPVMLTMSYTVDPAEYAIYDGVLTGVPVGRLESGMSQELHMVFCFIAEGRFRLTAQAHLLGTGGTGSLVGSSELKVIVQDVYDARTP